MQWFDNLWNNAPWILIGMVVVGVIQLGTVLLWEWLKDKKEKEKK